MSEAELNGGNNKWHSLSVEETLSGLDVTSAGLSAEEAKLRLQNYGSNLLPKAAKRSAFTRFLLQFHNFG